MEAIRVRIWEFWNCETKTDKTLLEKLSVWDGLMVEFEEIKLKILNRWM